MICTGAMTGGRRDNERFFTPADSPVMDTTRQAGLIGNSLDRIVKYFWTYRNIFFLNVVFLVD